jgi:hypothetical protein
MVDIAIAIFLGYDEAQALRTGGLTFINIMYSEIAVFGVLMALLGLKIILKKKNVYNKNHIVK